MDHLRFKAIFLQYGSNETKIMIANILSNIISNKMHAPRYVNLIKIESWDVLHISSNMHFIANNVA